MNNISIPYMPITLDNLEIKSTNILEGKEKVYFESLSQFKLSQNLQYGLHLRQGERHKYQFQTGLMFKNDQLGTQTIAVVNGAFMGWFDRYAIANYTVKQTQLLFNERFTIALEGAYAPRNQRVRDINHHINSIHGRFALIYKLLEQKE